MGSLNKVDSGLLMSIQNRLLQSSTYWGIKTLKNPMDFWVYQEIIYDVNPDYIIEIGNYKGGAILAYAHLLDQLNHGSVIGIDIDHSNIDQRLLDHPRVKLFEGDALEVLDIVVDFVGQNKKVIIIEDSSHEYQNTLSILRSYSKLVSLGSYFIVEDSICHHGLNVGPFPGPHEAIMEFLKVCEEFEVDKSKENFVITWNPNGFLRKVKEKCT